MKRAIYFLFAVMLAILFIADAAGQQSSASFSVATSNAIASFVLRSGTAETFTDQAIDEKTIDLILQCGIRAPSARNAQPWHFSVVTSRKMLEKMRNAAATGSSGGAQQKRDMFFGSSTVIVISGTRDWASTQLDCGLACENMSLAAQALGLGAHISTSAILIFNNGDQGKELMSQLGIPDDKAPVAVLVIGFPGKQTDATSQASPRNYQDVITYVR